MTIGGSLLAGQGLGHEVKEHPPERVPFSRLFGTPSRGVIHLERQVYEVGNRTLLFDVRSAHIRGPRSGTRLRTSARVLLDMLADMNDVIFENIVFECYGRNNRDDRSDSSSVAALVRWLHVSGRRIKFINCGWTAPYALTNAVKAICDIPGEETESIHFEGCWFKGVGRMAIELSNYPSVMHRPNDLISRHSDWQVDGCAFKDLGVAPERLHGMGVSVTGRATDIRVRDCTFDNVLYAAVEFAGNSNSEVLRCRSRNMLHRRSGGATNTVLALTVNNLLTAGPGRIHKMKNNRIEKFVCEDEHQGDIKFWFQEGLSTRDNVFWVSDYISYAGSSQCRSRNDRYIMGADCPLRLIDVPSNGGPVRDSVWEGLKRGPSSKIATIDAACPNSARVTGNVVNGRSLSAAR